MLIFILPMFFNFNYLYMAQETQWLALTLFAVGLLLANSLKRQSMAFSFIDLVLLLFAIWWMIRVDPNKENSPNSLATSLYLISLVLLKDKRSSIKLSFFVISLVSISWNLWGVISFWFNPRVFFYYGPFNQPNHYQYLNLLALFGSTYFGFRARETISKKKFILLLSIQSVLVFASVFLYGGKMVLISFFAISTLLVIKRSIIKANSIQLSFKITNIWGVVLVVVIFIGSAWLLVALPTIKGYRDSFSSRETMNMATFSLIHSEGGLGVGAGEYGYKILDYWPNAENVPYLADLYPGGAHNLLLNIWAELGLPGIILAILILGLPLGLSIRLFLKRSPGSSIIFPFFIGFYLMASSDYTSQGFLSAILLSYFIPVLIYDRYVGKRFFVIDYKTRALLSIALGIVLLFNGYQQIQQARADHLMRDVGLKRNVTPSDIPNFEKSLSIRSNSVALFYGSWLFLQNGDLKTAMLQVMELEKISGNKWPIRERKAQILIQEGKCNEAKYVAKPFLAYRGINANKLLRKQLEFCQNGESGKLYIGEDIDGSPAR